MHFIIISKHDNFQEHDINHELLDSRKAPVLISRESIKYELSNFIIYVYPYNQVDHELYGYSYYIDNDEFLLINGLLNVGHNLRGENIKEFFDQLNDSDQLFGDYQLIKLDKNGDGFIKTSPISIRQLFLYEDSHFTVLSTDIKLIVDGVNKFKLKPFISHFDVDFLKDSVFRELKPRKFPENTIFKEIKRIFPQDIKYFRKGKITVERQEKVQIPGWFRDSFYENKSNLFDMYYEFIMNFAEINLVNLKPNIKEINLGLTGGLDSRMTAAILSEICKKHDIPLICYTTGVYDHPDVVLAKKVAKTLDIKYEHIILENDVFKNSKSYIDYVSTFYMSWGDFNSRSFESDYNREIPDLDIIHQLGMDAFKRTDFHLLNSFNRWFARRILYMENFFFPIFSTCYEMWFALLYSEIEQDKPYKELVYDVLRRSNPDLLDIPFAGNWLPQVNVEPYLHWKDSKYHAKEPFLWDYKFVSKNLKPLLGKNDLGFKGKLILKLLMLNELDYFLNKNLRKRINQYRKKKITLFKCIKELLKERNSGKYPRKKTMVEITIDSKYNFYVPKLQILMDFASVANYRSFNEIESTLNL